MPAARFEHYKLIVGHFSVLTQAGFCRSRYSITLLRDPIKRIFSAYTFWRTVPEYDAITSKAKELSFTDFVRYFADSPAIIHNPYTHHLAAIGRDCPGYSADAVALLATAKHNLAAFDFVGICEELGLSLRLLCHELGWQSPANIPHENRTSSEVYFEKIEPQALEILRDRNQLDMELYNDAVEYLQTREDSAAKSNTAFPPPVEPNRFVPFPTPCEMCRRAIVQSVSATWLPDESVPILEITVNFRTLAPLPELSLGIQVNDAAGNIVWGTSTSRESLDLEYEMGHDCRASFFVECELPPDTYYVTVALSEPSRLGFHDHWIDHVALFTVAPPWVARWPSLRGMRSREFRSTVVRDVPCQ
jgi:hypothetical protein